MKNFTTFITEMPRMSRDHTKTVMTYMSDKVRKHLSSLDHHNKIGSDMYHHKVGDNHVYYNKTDNGIGELSVIDKYHTQTGTDKGSGSANNIHEFMKKHAELHGHVRSDSTNTKGSKHLWTSLIKSKPKNKSFYVHNLNTGDKESVDYTNIDSKSSKIWGTSKQHEHARLVMQHHDQG